MGSFSTCKELLQNDAQALAHNNVCAHPLKGQPLRLPSESREPRLKMVGFSGFYSLSEWFSYAKKSIEICGFNALIRFLFNF